eukprot:GHVN01050030.1.p1 GENE.GHVN01050030.1~~GHVN01050030.1.p1  ORF type:complete len:121 (-),score=13.72 GHVN01050030.1:42-404(-)
MKVPAVMKALVLVFQLKDFSTKSVCAAMPATDVVSGVAETSSDEQIAAAAKATLRKSTAESVTSHSSGCGKYGKNIADAGCSRAPEVTKDLPLVSLTQVDPLRRDVARCHLFSKRKLNVS